MKSRTKKYKKTLMVDANNLLYRAYFVSKLTDKKGRRVSGIFGTMKMITPLIQKFDPDDVIVAWDVGKSRERIALYPEYKSQRDKNRKEADKKSLQFQRKVCKKIFKNLPVRQIGIKHVEADDIIGYLCEKVKGHKIVVSNDQDFFQLVNSRTKLYLPNQKKLITHKNVDQELGFPAKHYILWKSLVGDASDNIKGVQGIGKVRATKIIQNGVGGGKKLPISEDEQKILDRNKYLIAIGALLQPDQIQKIRTKYKSEKNKTLNYEEVRKVFGQHDFRTLFLNFNHWRYPFDKLIRKGRKK